MEHKIGIFEFELSEILEFEGNLYCKFFDEQIYITNWALFCVSDFGPGMMGQGSRGWFGGLIKTRLLNGWVRVMGAGLRGKFEHKETCLET